MKENNIKVSIITVCFNSEKTIRRTIESVLYQTYPNIEYIIVDGKSTDGTVDIVKEYLPAFQKRLRYVSERDKGIYDAMNKGIRLSAGDVIGIINSDDFYEPDAVENIVKYADRGSCQVLYGYCNWFYRNCLIETLRNSHLCLDRKMIPHPSCFVTRKTYSRFGLFVTFFQIASDYELMLRFWKSGQVMFTQIPAVLANFEEGGISTKPEMSRKLEVETAFIWYRYKQISLKQLCLYLYKYMLCG